MEVEKKNIAIITTVFNWDLYKETQGFFPSGIRIFAVDGTKGLYGIKSIRFFLHKLKRLNIHWLIMADEDVVFTKPENVFDLIKYLDQNGFSVCGMRDGGELEWRNKNPHIINTFFSVLNLKDIHSIYNEKEMLSHQYIKPGEFGELGELSFSNYDEQSLFESYYCFFLWLIRKGRKTKFLKATNPYKEKGDYATTRLLDHKGRELLYHTWYARFYNKDEKHTNRIKQIIKLGKSNDYYSSPILLKDRVFHLRVFAYKYYRRILRKIKYV
ncbi:hypothetical protein [Christiangramia echinicola]|uniref:Glycosyl transferase family 2 n=1 Tax=Christiangramia echinicola TaxID=279359 RepID=A0A1H1L5B9_9FLAO|nr:hypothetical protein [Christiangramia echinicola]SDR69099.1 hypothetical protein SAMN04488552_0533 [Christiangramia echinicola]